MIFGTNKKDHDFWRSAYYMGWKRVIVILHNWNNSEALLGVFGIRVGYFSKKLTGYRIFGETN